MIHDILIFLFLFGSSEVTGSNPNAISVEFRMKVSTLIYTFTLIIFLANK